MNITDLIRKATILDALTDLRRAELKDEVYVPDGVKDVLMGIRKEEGKDE